MMYIHTTFEKQLLLVSSFSWNKNVIYISICVYKQQYIFNNFVIYNIENNNYIHITYVIMWHNMWFVIIIFSVVITESGTWGIVWNSIYYSTWHSIPLTTLYILLYNSYIGDSLVVPVFLFYHFCSNFFTGLFPRN